LTLLALLVALGATAPSAHASAPTRYMVKRINAVRAMVGLPRLHMRRDLRRSARRYASRLMRSGYFGHASRIQASRRYRFKGEILERHGGRRARVPLALRAWLRSPTHRAVMLNPVFRYIGAGKVTGRWRGHREVIWVVHFGRR
jgi:uncharacterized protein YkwD